MKWYAISGSWRTVNKEVEKDVREIVKKIIEKGDGIIAGGALGVDYIATQSVIENGNPDKQLKIYLPIKLIDFCKHYKKRASEGVITEAQADMICSQLIQIKKIAPESIIDDVPYNFANEESYFARNTQIIENCNVFYAFQANNSKGTQDAIDKARKLGKEVFVKKYKI